MVRDTSSPIDGSPAADGTHSPSRDNPSPDQTHGTKSGLKSSRVLRTRSDERVTRHRQHRHRSRRDSRGRESSPADDAPADEGDDEDDGEGTDLAETAQADSSTPTEKISAAPVVGLGPVILTDTVPETRNGRRRAGSPAGRTSHDGAKRSRHGAACLLATFSEAKSASAPAPAPAPTPTSATASTSAPVANPPATSPGHRGSAFRPPAPTESADAAQAAQAMGSALRLRVLAETHPTGVAAEGLILRVSEALQHLPEPRVLTVPTATATTTSVGAPAPAFAIFSAALGQFSPAAYTVTTGIPQGVPVVMPDFNPPETHERDKTPTSSTLVPTPTPLDLTTPTASLVVGDRVPAAEDATALCDFYTSVVMLYGSEMTVLPTHGDGEQELTTRLLRSVNAMDTTMTGGKFRTHGAGRRHMSAYRRRLWTVAAEYGREMGAAAAWPYDAPDGIPLARYYRGSVHFTAQVRPGPAFRPTADANLCVWTLVLTPRLRRIPEGRWLLTSLRGAPAVCQPIVTRGGHTGSVLLAFHDDRVPTTDQLTRVEMTAVLFLPSRPRGPFGVRLNREAEAHEETAAATTDSPPGLMSPVRRHEGMLTAMFSSLTWRVRSRCNERRQLAAVATAGFQCTQEPALWRETDCWQPGPPAVYELEDCEVRVQIETLTVSADGQRLFGTLIVTDTAPTGTAPPVDRLPTMAVLTLRLYGPQDRRPTFIFSQNPTPSLHFPPSPAEPLTVGDAEWGTEPVTVASPYQLTAREGRLQVTIDLHYVCPPGTPSQEWLVSSPFSETRFYTVLTVWSAKQPLRLTLVSPRADLVLPRGTVLATLYPIHPTTGSVRQLGERAALRLTETEDGAPSLCAGDLRLPPENFPCYDDV